MAESSIERAAGDDVWAEEVPYPDTPPLDRVRPGAADPLLRAAHALVAADSVRFAEPCLAIVGSGERLRQVRLTAAGAFCTCPLRRERGGDRGRCEHALAALLVRASLDDAAGRR